MHSNICPSPPQCARSRLDIEERAVRTTLAGNMRPNSSCLTCAPSPADRADRLENGLVVFFDGQAQQLAGVLQAVAHAVECVHDLFQAGTLAPQLLGLVGRVPDRGVFQLPAYLGEPLALGVVLKGTSSARRCAR